MIKIMGRSYLEEYWRRPPEKENILKAWFYRIQNSSGEAMEKIIGNLPEPRVLNLQLTPSLFLLAHFHERLGILRIRGVLERFTKPALVNFQPDPFRRDL